MSERGSEEIMSYPTDDGTFILDTDASNTGIGAALSQMQLCEKPQREIERPIPFASKNLTKSQRKYCVTRRELLAIIVFVHQFCHHLLGKTFVVRTDHSAVQWIWSFKEPANQWHTG